MIMSRGGALYNVDLFSHIVSNTARRVARFSRLALRILNYLDVMKLDIAFCSCRVYRASLLRASNF